ncbi:MAG: family 78 glycoside hydrolase catalytic domain [Promethearchaeota archaeon]
MVKIPWDLKKTWAGKWIWPKTFEPRRKKFVDRSEEMQDILPGDRNAHVLFRRVFNIENKVDKAIIRISVDSRYKLFVNGRYIGRGIPRCERFFWYYDEYDLTGVINEGKNVIAIQAVYFGEDLAWYQVLDSVRGSTLQDSAKGGLVFELEISCTNGEKISINSDDNTMALHLDAYMRDAPKKNGTIGRVDIVDLRKFPLDWYKLDYTCDAKWKKPLVLSYPIEFYVKRNIPQLKEEEINPEKIIAYGEVDDVGHEMLEDGEDEMPDFCIKNNLEILELPKNAIFKDLDHLLHPEPGKSCQVSSPGPNRAVYMLFDFGRNVTGYMHFLVEANDGAVIDMIPAEKIVDNQVDNGSPLQNKRGMSVTLKDGLQEFEQTLWDGFRYVMVKIRNIKTSIKIYKLNAMFTSYPYRSKGSFQCNDDLLNELWKACAYTLVLCTHDAYEDCPWREQRTYPGDAYVENLINYAVFGDFAIGKKFIYDVAFSQLPTGMTFSFVCGDAYAEHHIIPNYQLYWIFTIESHYLYSGDDSPIHDLFIPMMAGIEWWEKYIDDETKLLKNVPFWKFIDWNDALDSNAEINVIVNAQFYWALNLVSKYARMVGWHEKGDELEKIAIDIKNGINKLCWDENIGAYHDGLNDGKLDNVISQQTNAMVILLDIAPKARWERIIKHVFDKPAQTKYNIPWQKRGNTRRDPSEILLPQPFFMHFVNAMYAKIGRFDLMFKMFKEGWGRMINHPTDYAGTIWETWEQHGSRTHAWAATPAFDLMTHVLGIKPTSPGFERFEIQPRFHTLEWVEGVFPTVKGEIELSMKRDDDQYEYYIKIPPALDKKGQFVFHPPPGRTVKLVEFNGTTFPAEKLAIVDEKLVLPDIPSGTNKIQVIFH